MIKIVPHFMRVRNGESGEFVDYLVIKGAPGTIENLSYFSTNETGDSENLVMTQKGVTDIHEKLLSGETMVGSADSAFYAVYADRAENDTDGNPIDTTYATLEKVNGTYIHEGLLDKALSLEDGVHHFTLSAAYPTEDIPQKECVHAYVTVYKRSFNKICVVIWGTENTPIYYNTYASDAWTGWKEVIDSSNIASQSVNHASTADSATTATEADTATKVKVSANSTANDWLDVWFSRGADSSAIAYNQRARQKNDKFRYNPGTDTLRVGSITGNAATATKADKATTADKLNPDAFKTPTHTFNVNKGVVDMRSSSCPFDASSVYLVSFSPSGASFPTSMSGIFHFQGTDIQEISLGRYILQYYYTGYHYTASLLNHELTTDSTATGTLKFYKISS